MTVRVHHLVACLEQIASELDRQDDDLPQVLAVVAMLQAGDFHPGDAIVTFE
jgi:hypothetical protein